MSYFSEDCLFGCYFFRCFSPFKKIDCLKIVKNYLIGHSNEHFQLIEIAKIQY